MPVVYLRQRNPRAFFLVGVLFSGVTGFTGMSLTVRGTVRMAAAAREGGERVSCQNSCNVSELVFYVLVRPLSGTR